ncbi:MAG: hypothetical protein ACI9YL_002158, partial [Luteibaculaceae bacterium]
MKTILFTIITFFGGLTSILGQTPPEFEFLNQEYKALTTDFEVLYSNSEFHLPSSTFNLPFTIDGPTEKFNVVNLGTSGIDLFNADKTIQLYTLHFMVSDGVYSADWDSTTIVRLQKTGVSPNQVWTFEFENVIFYELPGEYWSLQLSLDEAKNAISFHYGPITNLNPDHPLHTFPYIVCVGEWDETTMPIDSLFILDGNPASPILTNGIEGRLTKSPELNTVYRFSYPRTSSIVSHTKGKVWTSQSEDGMCFHS